MKNTLWKPNFPQTAELEDQAQKVRYVIGLDLHKKTTAISVLEKRGNSGKLIFQRKRLLNGNLLETVKNLVGKKLIVCEAAFGWNLVRDAFLTFEDVLFVPLDARKVCAWAQASGVKNDRIDSEALAYAALSGVISRLAVFQASTKSREYFRLVTLRDGTVRQRTAIKNQLKKFFFDYGPNPFSGIIPEKSELLIDFQNCLLEQLQFLNEKISFLETKIRELSRNDEIISLLRNIPGIGEISAFAIRAKVDDISRFVSARNLCSYFGFAVREHQSGEVFSKGRINKMGNSFIRKLVVQGAQSIKSRHPEYYALFYPNMAKKYPELKKCQKLTVAVARKLLTFVFYSWKKQIPFNIEQYIELRSQENSKKTAELV